MPSFSQTRSIVVDADPSAIHPLIDDFHRWVEWSPWEGLDPELKRSYSGPDAGVGARYEWSGNRKAGSGSMEITASTPDRIDLDLEFVAPFKASNKTTFALESAGSGTRVSWTMRGERNLLFAVMGPLFFDRAIAKDFDRGLAALKDLAERR
ncbi:SRPBCC family protein [Gordonia sp. (in: high G+C Gram-positive bacteria)]|uniref:SRPBCC family protein n=1 Tax=Gordonia sp. (in: high G+C Gram-positive bacteria) TaxID=84139 RepID=UPI0035278C51